MLHRLQLKFDSAWGGRGRETKKPAKTVDPQSPQILCSPRRLLGIGVWRGSEDVLRPPLDPAAWGPTVRCGIRSCSLQKGFEQPKSSRALPVLLAWKGRSPSGLALNPAEARWPPASALGLPGAAPSSRSSNEGGEGRWAGRMWVLRRQGLAEHMSRSPWGPSPSWRHFI